MPILPYFHVDAFADRPFTGNQAAVMPLESWLDDDQLRAIGDVIEDLGADPNVAVVGGLNSIDVLGQWLWGGMAGKAKLTPAMRRCFRTVLC